MTRAVSSKVSLKRLAVGMFIGVLSLATLTYWYVDRKVLTVSEIEEILREDNLTLTRIRSSVAEVSSVEKGIVEYPGGYERYRQSIYSRRSEIRWFASEVTLPSVYKHESYVAFDGLWQYCIDGSYEVYTILISLDGDVLGYIVE